MEIEILSEHEIEVYTTPERRVKQRVITYQVPGLVPRTLWIDSEKLPDVTWQAKNPGKPIPPEVMAKGDAVRRAAVEADIARLKELPKSRKI